MNTWKKGISEINGEKTYLAYRLVNTPTYNGIEVNSKFTTSETKIKLHIAKLNLKEVTK